jgi:hypothetical protein
MMQTKNEYIPRGVTRIYHLIVFALLFTGFAQMPIFKRYYLADIPGFAWTADYYLNHRLHYILAALLLAFFTYVVVVYLTVWSKRFTLTGSGWTSTVLWLGIVVTGIMRVAKNQPDIHFSPETTMWIDWLHLGLVMLLGVFSLVGALAGRGRLLQRS